MGDLKSQTTQHINFARVTKKITRGTAKYRPRVPLRPRHTSFFVFVKPSSQVRPIWRCSY